MIFRLHLLYKHHFMVENVRNIHIIPYQFEEYTNKIIFSSLKKINYNYLQSMGFQNLIHS